MANNNISIKPISDLLKYKFFIPSYQRGYRWTEQQVTDLLNDINQFEPAQITNTNEETWYCLQPIVVKIRPQDTTPSFRENLSEISKNETDKIAISNTRKLIEEVDNQKYWEVIDGQQRLTTIYLILYCLNQLKPFDLEYETREGSENYLKKELGKKVIDYSNIDYFHISIAYKTISDWLKEKKEEKFELKFNDYTKVIWYESSKNEDSIDVFTRINSGKIPLTNAELIKALFLNSSNFSNADPEKLRFKQLEIASEWDRIEYALQDDSFWYFINKSENNLATRIEFIFNLMSNNKSDDKYSTFHFFNDKFKTNSEKDIINNWQQIKKQFQTLLEWYNNRELYHKIGYLITFGFGVNEILKEKVEKSKTDFSNWVNEKINAEIDGVNMDTLEYNETYVRQILLLQNIQTMLNNQNETNRFPFDRYKKEHWDVEHIHAIATEVKVKKENQTEWLKNNFIKTKDHQNEDINNQIEQLINSGSTIEEDKFDYIVDYVLGEEDNSLRNLCLLDRGTNRSYKNDSFKEKRKKIIEREVDGTFIPICTKNVFMKYYSSDVNDLQVWNENDKKSYFDEIKKVLNQYLSKIQLVSNEQYYNT